MYAQLIASGAVADGDGSRPHPSGRELFVALREKPGFCGGFSLFDRERGAGLLLLLWETEEQAAQPLDSRATSGPSARSVWEVDARV